METYESGKAPHLAPFEDDMFLNTERRCPVVLLLDTSASMRHHMDIVNRGLHDLKADLQQDALASQRVEIMILTFGPVRVVQDFVTVDRWMVPRLYARGETPMGEALQQAVHEIRLRKDAYREAGLPYYRPWIWLVTDGDPTDDVTLGVKQVREEVNRGGLEMFTIGTDHANFKLLRTISAPRPPVKLLEAKYREMFVWLSQSLKPVSRSEPGGTLELEEPTGWGTVQL